MKKIGLLSIVLAALVLAAVWSVRAREGEHRADGALPPTGAAPPAEPLPAELVPAEPLEPPPTASSRAESIEPVEGLVVELVLEHTPILPLSIRLVPTGEGTAPELAETYDRAAWPDIDPGRYRVEAWGEGWTSASAEAEITPGAGARVELTLQSEHWVTGRVIDRALARAPAEFQLEIELGTHDERGTFESQWARTVVSRDEHGRFSLAGAPDSAELLRVTASASGTLPASTDWLPARVWHDDLVLELGSASESIVAGRVALDGSDMPIAGAHLTLVDAMAELHAIRIADGIAQIPDSYDITGMAALGEARADTSADGRFELRTRHVGWARLVVSTEHGHAVLSEPFELFAGRETQAGTLLLESGGTLTGRVWSSEAGEGLRVLSVAIQRDDGPRSIGQLDPEGGFRFTGLSAGNYRVTALGNLVAHEGSPAGVVPVAKTTVSLAENAEEHVDLHCGSGLSGSTVRGRIVQVDAALVDVRILALDVDANPVRMVQATTDGTFELSDVPDGDFTLAIAARDGTGTRFAAWSRKLRLPQDARGLLEIALDQSRVTLEGGEAGGWIRVRAESDDAVFDALVREALQGTFDADGRAELHGLPRGSYRIETERGLRVVEVPDNGGAFAVRF